MAKLEAKFRNSENIYFHKEHLVNSLEGRKMEVMTISSRFGITNEREKKIHKAVLFPNKK